MSNKNDIDDDDESTSSSSSSFAIEDVPPRDRHYVQCDRIRQRTERRLVRKSICRECWLDEATCCCAALRSHTFTPEHADVVVYMNATEFGRKSNSTRAFTLCREPRTELVVESRDGDDAMLALFDRLGDSVALLYPSHRAISVGQFAADCKARGQRPTFVLLDATWAQASTVRKRLDRLLGAGRQWVNVQLDLPKSDAPARQKRRVAPLWRTPAENGGVSFSPARTQIEIGRITSVECLWLLLHELGEDNERVLTPLLEAIRIRLAFSMQTLLGARTRVDIEVLRYCDRIFNDLTCRAAKSNTAASQ